MGFFNKLFGKKKEEIVEEEPQEIEIIDYPLCEKCKMELKPDHFIVTFMNKKYHKQCLRQIRREARVKAFS